LIIDFLYGVASSAIGNITRQINSLNKTGRMKPAAINLAIAAKQSIARFPLLTSASISESGIFKAQNKMEYLVGSFIRLYITNIRSFIDDDGSAKIDLLADITGDRSGAGEGKVSGILGKVFDFAQSIMGVAGRESVTIDPKAVQDLFMVEEEDVTAFLNMHNLFDNSVLEESALGAVAPASAPAAGTPVLTPFSYDDPKTHSKTCSCAKCKAIRKAEKGDKPAQESLTARREGADFINERKAAIIEKKSDESEPVVVTGTLTILDSEGKISGTTDISIGVKCPIHIFPSEEFINTIVSGFSENNLFIRLMKWRAGEIGFLDAFLNKAKVDLSIVSNHKTFKGRAKNVKEILQDDKYYRDRVYGNEKEGANILVITDEEVREVERRTGKNLLDSPATAIRFCKNQKLFALMIYDEISESGKVLITNYSNKFEHISFKEKAAKGTDDVIKNIFGALRR
jgi:hypothetical protein